jgi:hypothetical protein
MTENDANKLYQRATGTNQEAPVIHVRVLGRSRDIALDLLDIGTQSPDNVIRDAIARFMEVSPEQLKGTVVERHENGNLTLRPEAVFG